MKERLEHPQLLGSPGNPMVMVSEVASVSCGCRVFIGRRLDNKEAATVACVCVPGHRPKLEDFNRRFAATLPSDSVEPLVDVAERLLVEADGAFDG
jgi:hypothetical protein